MKCENLSLCIINKDDASNLQRLIRRAKKFVGEIIVVDIGSKDASVAAALHAGATKVIERPDFLDDDGVLKSFALARNESFKHATKDWKMWLDTDDNLSDWNSLKDFIDHLQSIRDKGDKCTGCMLYDYTWSEDRKTCFQVLHRVRIVHRDDNFVWKDE
jgi:glycosyltransferase involved in cell wall biosynthesis